MKKFASKKCVEPRRMALARMLAHYGPWDTFGTGTFEYDASAAAAEKAFSRFMGLRPMKQIGMFWTIESHHHRDASHVHFVSQSSQHIRWSLAHKWWHERFGRFRTEKIDQERSLAPSFYLGKYMFKNPATSSWGFNKAFVNRFGKRPEAEVNELFSWKRPQGTDAFKKTSQYGFREQTKMPVVQPSQSRHVPKAVGENSQLSLQW